MPQTVRPHLLATLALLAPLALAAGPARAEPSCCVMYYDHKDAADNTKNIISTLSDKINAMQLAIVEAMRLGTGQLSGNSKEQIGAQSNMANVNDDRRVVGNVEMARFNAIRSAASGASSCNTTTAGIGMGGLNNNIVSLNAQVTDLLVKWDVGADESVPSSQGTDIAVAALLGKHCATYANQADVKAGLCSSAASGDLVNADIDISKSIFGKQQGSEASTLSTQGQEAAQVYMLNALDPRPSAALPPKEAQTTGGRERAAARNALAAKLSTAKYAMADIFSRRTPQNNNTLSEWAKATAGQISGYTGANFSEGVSWSDAMDIKARSWFMNANWGTAVSSQGAEQATKDSAHILAFSAYTQWELYKLVEKQNAMLASMVALLTEQAKGNSLAGR